MKSFVISLVFFLVTVSGIFANCLYVERELAEILEFLQDMPEVTKEDELPQLVVFTKTVNKMWQDTRPFLSLSVENALLRDCTVSLGNLEAFCESSSVPDYNAALSDCIIRLSHLLEREKFSFKNAL